MEALWVLAVFILGLSLHASQVQGYCPGKKMDIAILADASKSMKGNQRKTLYKLVSKLIDRYPVSAPGNHYGFITFDRFARIHNNFKNKAYYDEKALKYLIKKKVHSVPERKQWGTRSDVALHMAATMLFTRNGGDRPDAKNILAVFTDGKQYMMRKDRRILPFKKVSKSTKMLEDKDVSITVVGILGKNWKDKEYKLKMKEMAGKNGHVLMYPDFNTLAKRFEEVEAVLCSVNGGYTEWTISECSVTNGEAVKTFTRTCTNPPPSNGGMNCSELGPAIKRVPSSEQDCPVDGGYTEWTFSECSVANGEVIKTFTRSCTNPPPSNGGKNCSELGLAIKRVPSSEQDCPVDGGYSDWMSSECSVSCGEGVKTFTRTCTNPLPSNGGKNCSALGPAMKRVPCKEQDCPVDGGYTEWSVAECSFMNGEVLKTFTRTCTNPPPSNGGKNCSELGPAIKRVPSSEQDCPVDGGYTEWTAAKCSFMNGEVVKTFTRTCTNPPPSNGGKNCSELGSAIKRVPSSEHDCHKQVSITEA